MIRQPEEALAQLLRQFAMTSAGQKFVRYLDEQTEQLVDLSLSTAETMRCRQAQGGVLALRDLKRALTQRTPTTGPEKT